MTEEELVKFHKMCPETEKPIVYAVCNRSGAVIYRNNWTSNELADVLMEFRRLEYMEMGYDLKPNGTDAANNAQVDGA